MNLYRAWSILKKFKGSRNVPVIWYCIQRYKPIMPYNMIISNYDPQFPFVHVSQKCVNELFLEKEVEELRTELAKEKINLYVKEIELPLNEIAFPYAWMPADCVHGSYYLFKESYYKISVPICGYYYLNTNIKDDDDFGNLEKLVQWNHKVGAYEENDFDAIDYMMKRVIANTVQPK